MLHFVLQCVFTYYSAHFLNTTTELSDTQQLGETTKAVFLTGQGATVPNKAIQEPQTRYAFELDQGPSDSNIRIFVYEDLSALAVNPKDPLVGKMKGTCEIKQEEAPQ